MRKESASEISAKLVQMTRDLNEVAFLVRQANLDSAEQTNALRTIGKVMVTIGDKLLDPIFEQYPEFIPHPDFTPRSMRPKGPGDDGGSLH